MTGEQLKVIFEGGLASLAEHQQEIDRLNVFPVPDGDTGRNMHLTMQAAVRELQQVKTHRLSDISEALAKGSLMGARGNSGVILSQLIRGFADAVKGSDEITLAQFARAWQAAVSTAYQAVMKPVEGTMLTVARGFSQGLVEAAKKESDLGQALLFAVQKGNETLQLTPELLPVLKKAGVVDAGGKGLLVLLEGGLLELGKLRSVEREWVPGAVPGTRPAKVGALVGRGEVESTPANCGVRSDSAGTVADAHHSGLEGIGRLRASLGLPCSAFFSPGVARMRRKARLHVSSADANENPTSHYVLEAPLTSQLLGTVQDDGEDFMFTYCVEFLLRGDPACLGPLRGALQEYGGSLIVANIDDVIKIHVHSNHPGQVLEYCLQFGTLHNIQVSNMRDQWRQTHGDAALKPDVSAPCPTAPTLRAGTRPDGYPDMAPTGAVGHPHPTASDAAEPVVLSSDGTATASREIGVLAVAAGEGIEEIFRSLGAAQIVAGGQTMNPPVAEFVKAIEAMPNEQVLILPNNKNLIMAAEQAGKLVSRSVAVLATTSIQAGISALLAFNPTLDMTANIGKMEQAAGRIKAAEVTYAAHDALFGDTEIKQGELIGLWQGDIVAVGASLEQVLPATVDRMLDEHDELVTLLTGKDVLPEQADRVAALIRSSHPQIEVELQYGGQPVYYFLIGIE
ncbi:MAG: DAK2 domain-containing protein [Thermacetogeniaceae bacterium]